MGCGGSKAETEDNYTNVSQEATAAASAAAEAKAVCKFACPNIGCSKVFSNKHGMLCHKGRCKWRWQLGKRVWYMTKRHQH